MPDYRIYLMDGNGKIACAFDFEAHDDLCAFDKANAIRGMGVAEVWQRPRMVAHIEGHGEAAAMPEIAA